MQANLLSQSFHTPEQGAKDPTNTKIEIFIHGLHYLTTLEEIDNCLSKIGEVNDLRFNKEGFNEENQGYAFFTVSSKALAEELVSKRHVINGRIIHCDYYHKDAKHQKINKMKRVFIGGIPKIATDQELIQFFSKFGEVRAAFSIKDKCGISKGFGYVDFKDVNVARELVRKSKVLFSLGKFERLIEIREYKKSSKKKFYNKYFPMEGKQETTMEQDIPRNNMELARPPTQFPCYSRPKIPFFNCFMNTQGEMLEEKIMRYYTALMNNQTQLAYALEREIIFIRDRMNEQGYQSDFTGNNYFYEGS